MTKNSLKYGLISNQHYFVTLIFQMTPKSHLMLKCVAKAMPYY